MSAYEWLMILMELYICLVLTVEFWYDWKMNEHVKSIKRRTKKRFEFEQLNEGEGK